MRACTLQLTHDDRSQSALILHFAEPAADEARFLRQVLASARAHLVLDLHNVHTMAQNLGFAAEDYLAQLDLAQVIEIHVSGGSLSDGSWLPGGRALRLDSHDAAVPEAVWRLFEFGLGHHALGRSRLYVTSGTGHWLPFRLGVPCELAVLVLRAEAAVPVAAP